MAMSMSNIKLDFLCQYAKHFGISFPEYYDYKSLIFNRHFFRETYAKVLKIAILVFFPIMGGDIYANDMKTSGDNSPVIQTNGDVNVFYTQADNEDVEIIKKTIKDSFLVVDKSQIDTTKEVEKPPECISELNLSYPYIKYSNNSLKEKEINDAIIKYLHDWKVVFKESDYDDLGIDYRYCEETLSYEQMYRINNLIGFKFEWFAPILYSNAYKSESLTLNVNLKNSSVYDFKDIFKASSIEDLNKMVFSLLDNDDNSCTYTDNIKNQSDFIRDNQEFYIKDNKLYVVFAKYEISSGACGPQTIELDIDDLRPYLNKNGPFGFIVNN